MPVSTEKKPSQNVAFLKLTGKGFSGLVKLTTKHRTFRGEGKEESYPQMKKETDWTKRSTGSGADKARTEHGRERKGKTKPPAR